MGNDHCVGAREKAEQYKTSSKQYYIKAKEKAGEQVSIAKVRYADQLKEARKTFDTAKLKA